MRVTVVVVTALAVAGGASAGDADLLAAKAKYLPPAQAPFATDPDGLQARYNVARDLEEAVRPLRASPRCAGLRAALLRFARAQVEVAESYDRPLRKPKPSLPAVPVGCGAAPGSVPAAVAAPALAFPRGSKVARPEDVTDLALAARLGEIGRAYRGWAGFWVHDLRTGRTAGWNS